VTLASLGRIADEVSINRRQREISGPAGADFGLKNCANSLYICGVNRVFCVNEINDLASEKSGCESCRPSQFSRQVADFVGSAIRGCEHRADRLCRSVCQ
jgi:hypothetical protein